MDASEFTTPRIFTLNDPTVLRVFPPLAEEIGLNESICLLQIDFLISISRNKQKEPLVRDGKAWTRQSLRDLQKNWLPFWSPQTIARALNKLRDDLGLIFITNEYNEHSYDKSQWFALNPQGFGQLTSVALHMVQLNGTGVFQSGTALSQDGTTIPESLLDLYIGKSVREKTEYIHLLNQVVTVCKRDILTLEERDYEQVDKLFQMDITPEQIAAYYGGKDSWWFTVFWKGKQAHFPTPADVITTVGQAEAFVNEGMEVPKSRYQKRKKSTATDEYLRNNPQVSDGKEDFRL